MFLLIVRKKDIFFEREENYDDGGGDLDFLLDNSPSSLRWKSWNEQPNKKEPI